MTDYRRGQLERVLNAHRQATQRLRDAAGALLQLYYFPRLVLAAGEDPSWEPNWQSASAQSAYQEILRLIDVDLAERLRPLERLFAAHEWSQIDAQGRVARADTPNPATTNRTGPSCQATLPMR